MRKIKLCSIIFFWLTIVSLPLSFSISCLIGEPDIFGVAGIVRYSWIMWLFVPISICSLLLGKKLKSKNEKYKKNYIIAFICIPLAIIFGSFRFLFNNISYDINQIYNIEEKINLNIPNSIKIATNNFEEYNISYVKIVNSNEKKHFENEIKNNELWASECNTNIHSLLPLNIQIETANFDYFVFYNVLRKEYNLYPSDGENECVFIAYNCKAQRLIIVDEYKINLDY